MTAFAPGRRSAPHGHSPSAHRSSSMGRPVPKPRRKNPGDCTADRVRDVCQKAGFALTIEHAEQMAEYLRLLMQWNTVMNLVGGRDWLETLETLAMDSLCLGRFLDEQVCPAISVPDAIVQEVWDLGAGAGLPGIPLRIVWQRGAEQYHFVEAREKRALFLSTVLARIGLPNAHVFRGRAEQFMEGRKASIILSRAFMPWREVLELVRDHVEPNGRVILLTLEPLTPLEDDRTAHAVHAEKDEIPAMTPIPEGWQPAEQMRYTTVSGVRYFCSFTPIKTPS